MKRIQYFPSLSVVALGLIHCFSFPASAGTIITSGLPAGDVIVNISGTADGAGVYDSTQTYWYQPFNLTGTLLEYTFQPGTYNFRVIDPADAASMFSLPAGQLSKIYTAWTYNSPWVTDYLAFDSSAATNSSEYQLFAGAVTPLTDFPGFPNAATAYDTAISTGYYDQIVSGVGGRYHGTTSTSYTFNSTETLIFVIPDWDVYDNAGGVSVLVSPAGSTSPSGVPEPASISLALIGLCCIPCARRIPQIRRRLATYRCGRHNAA